ncbi:MSCRAMM family protein [Novosphingobium olei]|uniref:Carboxypeptidase regulatory-like domain-containing protein n=1 Tax=Novosphingobium olei TaxID=2728851 RepID=A0A7Y0GCG3_9SPHN|nr:carboxypeptidase-like regulatory domain-containing protein [Novosphingobium olei]NML96173.1 carboxypeptidase regulatory-like domain-containing protein [Novosphingobium olei]
MFKNDAGRQWLVTPGLQASIDGFSGRLDLGFASTGGRALVAAMAGRVGAFNWTLLHGEYANGFIDEQRSLNQKPLRRTTDIQVAGLISTSGQHVGSAIPIAGSFRRLEFADGSKETDSNLRASYLTRGLLLSNALTYQSSTQRQGSSIAKLAGTFDLATVTAGQTQARAALDYRIAPAFRAETAQLEVSQALGRDTMMRAALTRSFISRTTQLGFSIARSVGPLAVSLDATKLIARPAFSFTLRMGMSFGLNTFSGRLFAAKPGIAESGAAALRAFIDANGNHYLDEGEQRVAGLNFTSASDTVVTDQNGLAFLTGLGDGVHNAIRLDLDSLPDIDLAPDSPGIEFTPRAGHVDKFDFPLIRLAEVSGGVVLEGSSRPLSGIQVIIVSASGETLARDRTSAGGTFFFERIPPGTYRIAVDPRQARRLGIHELGAPLSVTITGKSRRLPELRIVKDASE